MCYEELRRMEKVAVKISTSGGGSGVIFLVR
jgi:hypothetical protein